MSSLSFSSAYHAVYGYSALYLTTEMQSRYLYMRTVLSEYEAHVFQAYSPFTLNKIFPRITLLRC
jgi:hypothetical protein